jgi:hypothetical protein
MLGAFPERTVQIFGWSKAAAPDLFEDLVMQDGFVDHSINPYFLNKGHSRGSL